MGYQLIETVTVGSGGASSIEFTGIPQDGVDLVLTVSGRRDVANISLYYRINGVSTASYSMIRLRGDGASASTNNTTDTLLYSITDRSSMTANTFSNSQLYISNYTSTSSKYISIDAVTESNETTSYQEITAGLFATSSSVSSIQIGVSSELVQYSTASLYKITAD